MTFQDAKNVAVKFGCKLPRYDHTAPVAECWIELLASVARRGGALGDYIDDANRYA